jgi:predicted dehydrogenase
VIDTIVVGAGKWAHECWVPLMAQHSDQYKVVAVVDPRPQRGASLAMALGLPRAAVHLDIDSALNCCSGATCGIVLSSPEHHAACITNLAGAGLDVLTEKPLATTATDVSSIVEAVSTSGIKLAAIQNYRYQNRIQTARRLLTDGHLGDVHFLTCRFAADYRRPGSWDVGTAHTMDSPLLIEGAIHHLDTLRYLAGRDIRRVAAVTRNPIGSSFAGDCIGGILLWLEDGLFAIYEATLLAAGSVHSWRHECYRVECAQGSLTCDGPSIMVTRERHNQVIYAPDPDMFVGHRTLLRGFAEWLDGGPPVETTLEDNLRSVGALLAAVSAATEGMAVEVQSFLSGNTV